jgi:hypothetical protein
MVSFFWIFATLKTPPFLNWFSPICVSGVDRIVERETGKNN